MSRALDDSTAEDVTAALTPTDSRACADSEVAAVVADKAVTDEPLEAASAITTRADITLSDVWIAVAEAVFATVTEVDADDVSDIVEDSVVSDDIA